jgi:predicted nucleotidyltransferase
VPELAPLDPERLITTLARHEVRYVMIGAMAARLQGFPRVTADADITPARDSENLRRLAKALRELKARVYTESVPEGLPFECSPSMLARADLWNLVTSAGRLDIAFAPSGTDGYADLMDDAVPFDVFGVRLNVASLEDIIRSKEAADRPQDRQDIVILREMLRRAR